MVISMMKPKNVMTGIKNGMTLEDFCKKYECDSEAFGERMKQIYGHNKKQLKDCFIQIEANQKKARKEIEADDAETASEAVEEVVAESATPEDVATASAVPREVELKSLAELESKQSQ